MTLQLTPEAEFILSCAGLLLTLFLTWIAFTRTRWASH
jgi:hypothetical protein